MSILMLFCTFFYIGLFTIGGGVVALTLMQQTIVDKGLIDSATFYNMVAISESTPGPLGINMATYIGYKLYGIPGGIIATAGEVLRALICSVSGAGFWRKLGGDDYVEGGVAVLRPVSTGLVLLPFLQIFVFALLNVPEGAGISGMMGAAKENIFALFDFVNIAAYAFFTFLFFKFKLHPIFIIAAGAVFGIIFL